MCNRSAEEGDNYEQFFVKNDFLQLFAIITDNIKILLVDIYLLYKS